MQKKKHSGEELYGELGEAFNFTQGDLEANRAGFISARQQRILRHRRLLYSSIGLILSLVGLAPLMALIGSFFDPVANESPIMVWITIVLISIPFLIAIPWIVNALVDSLREFGKRRVTKYEGKVETGFTENKRKLYYHLIFDFNGFSIGEKAYHLMNSDRQYRIYYLPKSNKILSVE